MLVAGRDGVMLQTRPCWEEASTATVSYREYRRVALPIGSGVTEAACKTIFNYRFK
jgi:hypothetical protein